MRQGRAEPDGRQAAIALTGAARIAYLSVATRQPGAA
jgi:hypothetical protein